MTSTKNIEGIAVVGMSGRFPRADDLEEFWQNLRDGVEAITTFSPEELEAAGVSPKRIAHPQYVRAAGVIEGAEEFDAAFFDFTPGEAPLLDPHHRLFLEHSWWALENAGYDPRTYEGIIGVYGGMGTGEYALGHLLADPEAAMKMGGLELRIYNDKDFLASLAAYKLDLRGPSASVQTACSTSLVTTAMACQSLLNYQCDLALSGGVAVSSTGRTGYFAREGVFSPDGHCRAFDAEASGTVAGYGAGVLVLKRLDRALEDGDTVHAVIRGWAINNDGSLKVGYTAPSVDGQAEVVAMAQALAGVEAETITYVETHGTGTPLGDQIEIAALSEVFGETTDKTGFCAIGSVKTNIGHLDAAAGVASLIKTILALEHGQLPPSLNYEKPNPQIEFESTPFYVQSELADWPAGEVPRRAGVSAFAVGGVNAHLIVEEAPEAEPPGPARRWQLLPVSARTETAVETLSGRLAEYLRGPSPAGFADVAHTLRVGRRAFEHRRVVVAQGPEEAAAAFAGEPGGRLLEGHVERGAARRSVFLFPGLGNHYAGMARGLYRDEPVFREHLDRCAEILESHLELDFRTVLYRDDAPDDAPDGASEGDSGGGPDLRRLLGRGGDDEEGAAGELLQTRLAQPVVFAVEYALARLWMSWGIEPEAMLGFSIGEYVAACLAGVFELEDALALVAERARMIDALPAGAMLAVTLSEEEVAPLLGEELSITAINGPEVVVVGGPPEAVAELEKGLGAKGVVARRLETSHAFHSKMMEPAAAAFRRRVGAVALSPPRTPFVSNVTGTWISAEEATDPGYWAEHLLRPVRFADGVEALWQDPRRVLLEVGPGQALSSWALQLPAPSAAERTALASMRHAYDPQPDAAFLLTALGRLWLLGVDVDWPGLDEDERRHRVALPTYPFERRRFWIDKPRRSATRERAGDDGAEGLGKSPDPGRWFFVPSWRRRDLRAVPGEERENRRWLLFIDAEGLGLALAERLEARGDEVVIVAAGRKFEKVEEGTYTLDPASPTPYAELFADLDASGLDCGRIVHLFTVSTEAPTPERALDLGLTSLLHLAQALGERRSEKVELSIVSSHLHQVTGADEVHPEKAAVLGPAKVIPLEYPGVSCRSIEVDPPPASSALEARLLDPLLSELDTGRDLGAAVAYRGARRWVREFERVPAESPEGLGRLRERGVYLITGGFGGIGLTLAEELARACRARLVLVGRSEFPAAEAWDTWLEEHPPGHPVSRKIRFLRRLEEMGAEVLGLSADVADTGALERVRELTLERFGELHGIVHAAGLPPGGLIQVKTREELMRVLAPKQAGTRALDQVFADEGLDFVLLCSSLTALVGALGLVDHTAANALLDAYAQAAIGRGDWPVTSVNWDAWLEVGQAAAVASSLGWEMGHEGGERRAVGHPLLEACVEETEDRAVYSALLSRASHWMLEEHRLLDRGLMPGTAYLEAARAAWADRVGDEPCELRQVLFLAPLTVEGDERRELRVSLAQRGEHYEFHVDSRLDAGPPGGWVRHAEGKLAPAAGAPAARDLDELRAGCPEKIEADDVRAESESVYFGPRWQAYGGEIRLGEDRALVTLELAEEFTADLETYGLHPALLDAATGFVQMRSEGLHLPLGYEKIELWRPLPRRFSSYAEFGGGGGADGQTVVANLTLVAEDGEVLAEISEYTLRRVDPTAMAASSPRGEAERGGADVTELATGLRPSEGARAFRRLLGGPELPEQVLISTRNFARIAENMSQGVGAQFDQAMVHARHGAGGSHPRPQLATPFVAPRNELEEELAGHWSELLGLDEVGVDDNFFDLGGDSLLATRLVALIEEKYAVHPTLRSIFEAPTVAQLSHFIVELQAQDLDDDALAELLAEIEETPT